MTTAGLFSVAGEMLFGPQWKSELGRKLNVDQRQIRRWADGDYEPPVEVWEAIAAMAHIQKGVLDVVERRTLRVASRLRGGE